MFSSGANRAHSFNSDNTLSEYGFCYLDSQRIVIWRTRAAEFVRECALRVPGFLKMSLMAIVDLLTRVSGGHWTGVHLFGTMRDETQDPNLFLFNSGAIRCRHYSIRTAMRTNHLRVVHPQLQICTHTHTPNLVASHECLLCVSPITCELAPVQALNDSEGIRNAFCASSQ